MRDLRIGTFDGVVSFYPDGSVIAIFNQCAYHPTDRSMREVLAVAESSVL